MGVVQAVLCARQALLGPGGRAVRPACCRPGEEPVTTRADLVFVLFRRGLIFELTFGESVPAALQSPVYDRIAGLERRSLMEACGKQ